MPRRVRRSWVHLREQPRHPLAARVAATPQQALRTLALDLYERGRQADKPDTFPPPSTSWGVSDAPKIARCLHSGRAVPAHKLVKRRGVLGAAVPGPAPPLRAHASSRVGFPPGRGRPAQPCPTPAATLRQRAKDRAWQQHLARRAVRRPSRQRVQGCRRTACGGGASRGALPLRVDSRRGGSGRPWAGGGRRGR
jgi:hypothetical protein